MGELQNLIKDTKNYLLAQENKHFLLSKEERAFFTDLLIQKENSPSVKEKKKNLENEAARPEAPLVQKSRPIAKIEQKIAFNKFKEEKPLKKSFLKNEEVKLSTEKPNDFIILEKPPKAEISFEKLKSLIEEISPSYPLASFVPSDEKAKMISLGYKLKKRTADITILSFKESPQGELFLKNLALALDICFMSAKVISALEIESENKWDILLTEEDLKLIIACDYSIWELPRLLPHYKEVPSKNEHFLGEVPLFLLPDVSLYLKEPLLKKSLFTALRKKLSI